MDISKEHYFISAGEFSGDLLAADLVRQIAKRSPHLVAAGITGAQMRSCGVETLVDNAGLSVMGLSDVAGRIGDLRRIEQRIIQQVDMLKPKFAVLVDYPGLHLRLAEQFQLRGIPVVQYVAPKVWAWGQGRVKKIRQYYDMVLGMLPFEEDFFKKSYVNYSYVGSPLLDRIDEYLKNHPVPMQRNSEEGLLLSFLPGSRASEIKAMLPLCFELKNQLNHITKQPYKFIVPIAENIGWQGLLDLVPELMNARRSVSEHGFLSEFAKVFEYQNIYFVEGENFKVMQGTDAGVITSGTATLECALLGTPQVVVYKTNTLTYSIF